MTKLEQLRKLRDDNKNNIVTHHSVPYSVPSLWFLGEAILELEDKMKEELKRKQSFTYDSPGR